MNIHPLRSRDHEDAAREYEDGEQRQSAAQGRPAGCVLPVSVGRVGDLQVSLNDSPPDRNDGAARSLAVDLQELIWATNSRDPFGESSHWLHLEAGQLLFLASPDAADEVAEGPRDSYRWLCVEPIESSQAFEIMDRDLIAAK